MNLKNTALFKWAGASNSISFMRKVANEDTVFYSI